MFLICLFLFILVAPLAVFWSQGYRFDFESRKISQTGGLFLKVIPRQVNVYIDGKPNKRTDFFFGSLLIENLLPKKYNVTVVKEGYHSWEKNLEIKEKEVTEIKNIVLFPKNVNFNLLSGRVKDFWFSPDQRKIIIKEIQEKESSLLTDENESKEYNWSLKLYDLNKNVRSHLVEENDFFSPEVELINLYFSEDSKKIYLEVKIKNKERYFELNLEETRPTLIEIKFIFPALEDLVAWRQINDQLYYLDNSGHFFKVRGAPLSPQEWNSLKQETKLSFALSDFLENYPEKEKLSAEPFLFNKDAQYDLKIFQNFIFLQENDTLFKFNSESKVFEYFFEKINSLKISPDNKKLAYFSDHEIWLLFLSDKKDFPARKEGEKVFLIRLSEKIIDLSWINSDYLIFSTEDKIRISEINDQDRVNIIDFFEIKKLSQKGSFLKMFFNQFNKKLYFLKDRDLYSFEALVF